jgi:hypothetical protein
MGHLTSTIKVCLMFDNTIPLRLIQTSLIYKKVPTRQTNHYSLASLFFTKKT